MKVKEIIEALLKVDEELEVRLVYGDERDCEYEIINIERIANECLTNPNENTDTVYIVY
jgi:hypothetical protein